MSKPASKILADLADQATSLRTSGGLCLPLKGTGLRLPPMQLRPISFSMPRFCFRHLEGAPKPKKGRAVSCVRCKRSYVAKKVRPPRTGGTSCHACGHTTPKGPKRKKRWQWVALHG